MHYQLGRAFRYAQRTWGADKYTLEQLRYAVRQVADSGRGEEEGEEDDPTTAALIWRLGSALGGSTIFDDFENMELDELFQPGMCTIVQLNEVDRREQQVIVATFLRRVYQARVDTKKGKVERRQAGYVPFPVFCLLEEAHNYAPANADAVSSDMLKTILSEGRKFGVSIGLISQRPGRLDSDVLSQCMTQCIMRITNPIDQNRIAESIESVGPGHVAGTAGPEQRPGDRQRGQRQHTGDAEGTPPAHGTWCRRCGRAGRMAGLVWQGAGGQ